MSVFRRFKECEKQLEETKGLIQFYYHVVLFCVCVYQRSSFFLYAAALSKEDGNDEDMAEMIAFEIDSLSKELKDLEENLKVFNCILYSVLSIVLSFDVRS